VFLQVAQLFRRGREHGPELLTGVCQGREGVAMARDSFEAEPGECLGVIETTLGLVEILLGGDHFSAVEGGKRDLHAAAGGREFFDRGKARLDEELPGRKTEFRPELGTGGGEAFIHGAQTCGEGRTGAEGKLDAGEGTTGETGEVVVEGGERVRHAAVGSRPGDFFGSTNEGTEPFLHPGGGAAEFTKPGAACDDARELVFPKVRDAIEEDARFGDETRGLGQKGLKTRDGIGFPEIGDEGETFLRRREEHGPQGLEREEAILGRDERKRVGAVVEFLQGRGEILLRLREPVDAGGESGDVPLSRAAGASRRPRSIARRKA
jgi:hypothetical protein